MAETAESETAMEEGGTDYKKAVKDVIRKQLKELLVQLEENGEEVAVFAVDIGDFSGVQMGTTKGESFMEHHTDLMPMFMDFCKSGPRDETDIQDTDLETSKTKKDTKRKSANKKTGTKPTPVAHNTNYTETLSDVLRVEIPKQLTSGITNNEVSSLVGHLVGAQLVTTKQRGDTAGSTLKFKKLLELANKSPKKNKQGVDGGGTSPVKPPSTPSSTRSGRKVSSKFLESINSLKKQSRMKAEQSDDEFVEEEEEKDMFGELASIDPLIIKRIHIKSGDGKLVDATFTELTSSPQLESLAVTLINKLDKLPKCHSIFSHKYVKVVIISNEDGEKDSLTTEIIRCDWNVFAKNTTTEKQQDEPELAGESINLEEVDAAEESQLRDDLAELAQDGKALDGTEVDVKANVPKATGKKVKVGKSPSNISPAGLVRKPKGRHYTETMPVECPHCGITLTGRSNLKSHIKRVHMQIKNHKCTICTKGFWSANALESHMLSVHTRQCEACSEYVVESVPWSAGIDMKTRRDVICTCGSIVSICSMFGRKRMYLHDDEPDEQGNIYHKRPKNNPGTKYACGTCGKLFMKKSNCERHSRKHSEDRKCICDICGTSYIYESSLKKHMYSEHGIVKYVCEICGGNYATMTALKVHCIKAHKDVKLQDTEIVTLKQEYVQNEGELEEDLEALERQMEAEERQMETEERQTNGEPEIIINGSSGEIIVQHRDKGHQEIMDQNIPVIQIEQPEIDGSAESIVVSGAVSMEHGEQIILKSDSLNPGEEHIVFDQGGHIVVTSQDDETGHIVVHSGDTDQNGHIVVQSGEMDQTGHIVVTSGDTDQTGHIVVHSGDTDQTGHIVVHSGEMDQTAQLVQQVIDGQVVGQDGNMSMIIKQVPVENEIY